MTYVRSGRPDLTNTQLAVLLITYMTPGPHYSVDIAAQLRADRSVISRAVARLVALRYLRMGADCDARRKAILTTEKGTIFLEQLKESLATNVS